MTGVAPAPFCPNSVYAQYSLPNGLRQHMLNAAAVVDLVGRQSLSAANRLRLVRAMLIHDIGNVVRPDFGQRPDLLGEAESTIGHWVNVGRVMSYRYGQDDHAATIVMASEIGLSPLEVRVIRRKSSKNISSILERGDVLEMAALYSDMRVAPAGVVSVSERIQEAQQRHAGRKREGLGNPAFDRKIVQLERTLSERIDFSAGAICDSTVAPLAADFATRVWPA